MAAFSTNPDVLSSIAALSSATWAYAGLSAAFELGIVRALDAPASAEELGSRLDLEPTLVADLLGVLIPLGAVERRGDRYALTAEFEPFRSGSMAKVMRAGVRSDHLQTAADALRRARDRPGLGASRSRPPRRPGRDRRTLPPRRQARPPLPSRPARAARGAGERAFSTSAAGVGVLSTSSASSTPK